MTVSGYAQEMFAAMAWGKDPETWYGCSRAARAAMVATVEARSMIETALMPEDDK